MACRWRKGTRCQRRQGEVSYSVAIGTNTLECGRHGHWEAVAELHRKPFDHRMMAIEHIANGRQDKGG